MKPIGRLGNENVQVVSELINNSSRRLDEDKIRRIFLLLDAEAILSIPLSRRCHGVGLRAAGIYSVKTAYHAVMQAHNEPTWRAQGRALKNCGCGS